MKLAVGKSDYLYFGGFNGVKNFRTTVHLGVLFAFKGPRPPGAVARHLNGKRQDNRASNLKWGTVAQNVNDRRGHGTWPAGDSNGNAKLTRTRVEWIRAHVQRPFKKWYRTTAKRFGVSWHAVQEARLGRTWK